MKIRNGYVSNSSSTSFVITNNSNKEMKLSDFAEENIRILKEFNEEYDYYFTEEEFLFSINKFYEETFMPGESKILVFGDEDRTIAGQVYDYGLRDGGTSENWHWHVNEYLR